MKDKKPFLELLNKEENITTKTYIMTTILIIAATTAFGIFVPFNILSETSPIIFSLCVGTILVGVITTVILIHLILNRIKKKYFNMSKENK